MNIRFTPLSVDWITAIRAGGPDANGQPAEHATSDGGGNPCRCCLKDIGKGQDMLVLAARPFPTVQPYAETGPIFLCRDCEAFAGAEIPPILTNRPSYLIKGYMPDHRIAYGTGKIVTPRELPIYCKTLLTSPDIAYLHVRSATNNCYQAKVIRDDGCET